MATASNMLSELNEHKEIYNSPISEAEEQSILRGLQNIYAALNYTSDK